MDSIFEFKEWPKTPCLGVRMPSNSAMFFGMPAMGMEMRQLSVKARICPFVGLCSANAMDLVPAMGNCCLTFGIDNGEG